MSVRKQIVARFKTLLDPMVTTHLAKTVVTRRPAEEDYSDAELPVVNIRDTASPVEAFEMRHLRHDLTVEIIIYASGSDSPDELDAIASDIVSRIEADTPTLGGLAIDVALTGHEFAFQRSGKLVSAGLLTYGINYRTPRGTI